MYINTNLVPKEAVDESNRLNEQVLKLSQERQEILKPLSYTIEEFINDHHEQLLNLKLNIDSKIIEKLTREFDSRLKRAEFERYLENDVSYDKEGWELLAPLGECSFNALKFSIINISKKKQLQNIRNQEVNIANQFYTPTIQSIVGKEYEALYWCPNYAPFNDHPEFTFIHNGRWTFIDAIQIDPQNNSFKEYQNPRFVAHNVTHPRRLPRQITKKPNLFSFLSQQYTNGNALYESVDRVLAFGGLLMTESRYRSVLETLFPNNYPLILDPKCLQLPYSLFLKTKG